MGKHTEACSEPVWPTGGFRAVPCSRPGKVLHEGRWYCGTHSPEAKERRRALKDARHKERDRIWAASMAREERKAACLAAFHSPDREIATEQITEGLFWEMQRMLAHVARSEAAYRKIHDFRGDGSLDTGHAWDIMRHAGDDARAFLAKLEPME